MEEKKVSYYDMVIKNEWTYTTGAVIMSILAVLLAMFAGSWGVSGPLAIWGGKVLTFIGIDADSWSMYNGSIGKYRFLNNQGAITDVALIVVWFVFALNTRGEAPAAGFMLFVGLGIGYAIQHSRFCFTAAYRDPTLTGSTKMAKALLVALAVSTIGFAGIHMSRYGVDLSKLPENAPGSPIGLHLLIGSFIFGIGAVLAGGCASGTFVRVGEGYVQSAIGLVFFIVGSMIGTPLMSQVVQKTPFLYSGKSVYLPKLLGGFGPAILLQLLVLLGLWIFADQWEKKKIAAFNSKG
jgi:uncharacterized membrane protein YedE/YeeE